MDTLIEKWLRNDRQSSLSARKRAASASFQPRGQLLRALRVQSRGGRHPALAGDPDGVRGVFELPDRMRVRPHREEYALLAPRSAESPVEVETVWRAVDFDRATGASRRRGCPLRSRERSETRETWTAPRESPPSGEGRGPA